MTEEVKREQEFFNPEELFRSIDKIRETAPSLEPLWGYLLFRKAITSLVSDPGVGKTSFCYSLVKSLCKGLAFLGITAEKVINALLMDFESSDALVAGRANLIIGDENIPNLVIYNSAEFSIKQVNEPLLKFVMEQRIDLLIIDNQTMAFETRDENDNSEAAKQMKYIRAIAERCNVAVLLVHHTSKANLIGTRKGTGAYARARMADICVNLEIVGEEEPRDQENLEETAKIIQFDCVKNRMVDEKVLWYIKRDKGQFTTTEPPLGMAGVPTDTKIYKAQSDLLNIINSKNGVGDSKDINWEFSELVNKMASVNWSENWTDHALRKLLQQNRIIRLARGIYSSKKVVAGGFPKTAQKQPEERLIEMRSGEKQ